MVGISDGDEGNSEGSKLEAIESLSISSSGKKTTDPTGFGKPTITPVHTANDNNNNATNADTHTGSETNQKEHGHTHRGVDPPDRSTYLPTRTVEHLRQRLTEIWVESGGVVGAESNGGPGLWGWLDWVGCGEGVLESLEREVAGAGYM